MRRILNLPAQICYRRWNRFHRGTGSRRGVEQGRPEPETRHVDSRERQGSQTDDDERQVQQNLDGREAQGSRGKREGWQKQEAEEEGVVVARAACSLFSSSSVLVVHYF
jgi:hypothetical protein